MFALISESSRPMLLRGAQACGLTSSQRRYVLSGDPEGIDLKGFGWNFENLKLVEISFFIVFFFETYTNTWVFIAHC